VIQEDELIADVTELLSDLVEEGQIEVATRHGPTSLAMDLSHVLETEPNTDLELWFLDHDEVVELYLDADALHQRVKPILHRLVHGDPPPKWNDALAKPIYDNPDDLNARMVFADWLQQEGDPRGELITLHSKLGERVADTELTLEDEKEREKDPMGYREKTLRRRFRGHFYGAFSAFDAHAFRFSWRLGFLDRADVMGHDLDKLIANPSSRFLERLLVTEQVSGAAKAIESGTMALPPTLKDVAIGKLGKGRDDDAPDEESEDSDEKKEARKTTLTIGGGTSINKLPRVTELSVSCRNLNVLDLDLPKVTDLQLFARTLTMDGAKAFSLPSLEYFAIVTDDLDVFSTALAELFENPPKKLTRFRLSVTRGPADPFAYLAALFHSPLMKQLKELDLRNSGFNTQDLPFFVDEAKYLKHLETLDLRRNYIGYGREEEAVVSKFCKNVLLGRDDASEAQEEADEDYDEEEDEEGDCYDADGYYYGGDPVVNEDEHENETLPLPEEDDDLDEDTKEELEEEGPGAVDRDAPVEERERYDEPVE
jgi:uncharacterized protein (TIGR02996 family)